jgi:hypothetical protein
MKRSIEISGPNGIRIIESDEKGNLRYSLSNGETGKIIESNGIELHLQKLEFNQVRETVSYNYKKCSNCGQAGIYEGT